MPEKRQHHLSWLILCPRYPPCHRAYRRPMRTWKRRWTRSFHLRNVRRKCCDCSSRERATRRYRHSHTYPQRLSNPTCRISTRNSTSGADLKQSPSSLRKSTNHTCRNLIISHHVITLPRHEISIPWLFKNHVYYYVVTAPSTPFWGISHLKIL